MLIRFKFGNDYVRIYNLENIRELRQSYREFNNYDIVITGNDNEQHYCGCSSREQAIKALDKIYTAYADGLRAITIEVDNNQRGTNNGEQ